MNKPKVGGTYSYSGFGGTKYRVKVTKVTRDRVIFKVLSGAAQGQPVRSMTLNQWAAKG